MYTYYSYMYIYHIISNLLKILSSGFDICIVLAPKNTSKVEAEKYSADDRFNHG